MNVSLTQELERWVQSRVDEGLYQSASEVVREGLRLLIERERLQAARVDELRRELRLGADALDRGERAVADDALFAQIRAEGQARLGSDEAR